MHWRLKKQLGMKNNDKNGEGIHTIVFVESFSHHSNNFVFELKGELQVE